MRLVPSALLLSMLVVGCTSQAGTETNGSARGNSNAVAAPAFKLTDIKGQKFALADFKGKVVFIDFWATWCPPCVISVPEVEKLYDDYKDKNVEVLSISLDQDESSVLRFADKHSMRNRVALAADSGIEEKYRVQGIPAFFVINKEGQIVNAWEGYNPAMISLWRKELDRQLGV